MKGDSIPYVPELSFSLQANYEFQFANNWTGKVGGNLSWVDKRHSEFETNIAFNEEFDSYTLVNLIFGVEYEHWNASVNVNNLFNDDKLVDIFRTAPGLSVDSFLRNRPRSVLFTVGYQY